MTVINWPLSHWIFFFGPLRFVFEYPWCTVCRPFDLLWITLNYAFVTSRLDYCNALYVGMDQASIKRLQLVQNAAARLLTGHKKRDHITPILASLHWLPIRFRIDFKILLFVFKALNGLAPAYIAELLQCYTPARALRSADQLLLV